ncbi:uncharacterized protein [Drosophila tropicalis]|uniref:uncharacterized protein n=1 Tax=Drosophila tropicalis TaxID=46794 RepID=UPI0035ABD90C
MDPDSRRKLNLQGVLKYAVENTPTNSCDSPQNQQIESDSERSLFLQNALKAMTTDITKDLKTALVILDSNSTDLAEKIESLEIIRDQIDDIDLANSFVKLGGTNTLLRFIKESDSKLKILAIYIVAEMAQNNPFCQDTFLKENYLPHLVAYMKNADNNIAKSSIYAVSSLIRNFNPGLNQFIRINGINTLLSCLRSTQNDVYIKAAFLIGSLSSAEKSIREVFVKQHTVPVLLENLKYINEFDAKQETTLFALSALSVDCKWNLPLEKRLESEAILKEIKTKNVSLDTCQDIVNSATNILENQYKSIAKNK